MKIFNNINDSSIVVDIARMEGSTKWQTVLFYDKINVIFILKKIGLKIMLFINTLTYS